MDLCWILKSWNSATTHQEAQFGNEISNLATMIPALVMTPSNLHVGDCSSRLFKCSNLYCKCFLLNGRLLKVSRLTLRYRMWKRYSAFKISEVLLCFNCKSIQHMGQFFTSCLSIAIAIILSTWGRSSVRVDFQSLVLSFSH